MPDYKLYTEGDLMLFIVQDNEDAFNELYTRHWKTLYAVAYGHLKNIETCEDVVHDVFASLWMNRHKIEARDIISYLAVAVKYTVIQKIKKQDNVRRYEQSLTVTDTADTSPAEIFDYKIIEELMHDEVEKLPEKCKLIFKYSREAGMPIKEIAKKMNISPLTVKNQLAKALKHLKKTFKLFSWFWWV